MVFQTPLFLACREGLLDIFGALINRPDIDPNKGVSWIVIFLKYLQRFIIYHVFCAESKSDLLSGRYF
jgi:hypothetical protein